jgi:predicted DNA-binding transcriptional regulator YafY
MLKPMYDPSMRVLTILEVLQARERVSGSELAATLEVSIRTVQRYVARLQDLGVPVQSTRGPGGTYHLKPGFRLPPMMFSTEEAFALALGLDALSYLGIAEVAPASAAVKTKLERVLPAAISSRVKTMRDVLILERPKWINDADIGVLMTLATAVQANQRVKLEYISRGGQPSSRLVEPYGLMQHDGRWFLAGHCCLRQEERLFRVDRIRSLEVSQESFTPPENIDVRHFVISRLVSVPAPMLIEVYVEASLEYLERELPQGMVLLEPEGSGVCLKRGEIQLEWFAALLLQLNRKLEVRSPPELKTAFQNLASRALMFANQNEDSGA